MAISRAHASSLRASVRRQGEWYNLDYSHQLGYGARAMAAGVVGSKLEDFKAVTKNLLQDPELEEASDLVRQARRILESGTEELFGKSQLSGMTIHTKSMKPDSQLWNYCDDQWGRGSGYRSRVSGRHEEWFDDSDNIKALLQALVELIEKEWQEILKRLEAILDVKEDEE